MRKCRTLLCIGTSATTLFAAVSPPANTALDAIRVASPPGDIWATFDPEGEFDHDGLPKDPGADGQPLADEFADESGDEEGDDGAGERGGPPNDDCGLATVIPGTTVTYNPALYSTVGASIQPCEVGANCEVGGGGESNSVWYSYTPAASGTIVVDTFGSSYNTVLSIFTGCGIGSPPFCSFPPILACNDDYPFGTQSQVTLNVTAGQSYRIKVSDYNSAAGGGTLNFNLRWFPPNDACVNATEIADVIFNPPAMNTQNAVDDVCENEESCEVNNVGVSNSVWYTYTPPCNGFLSINTNGSSYDTVLSIWDVCGVFIDPDAPCDFGVQAACDDDSGTGVASQLLDVPVTEGVEYLIKVSDYNNTQGGGNLDFNFVFHGGGQPTADIASPSGFGCVCGTVNVIGTAAAGAADPAVAWVLDYQPVSGGSWTQISAGNAPVTNASLGSWNTTALAQGYYLLRLTVENACGTSSTAIEVVLVDQVFDSLDLREPDTGDIVGGIVCVDGTAWDLCFSNYRVDYRPSGGGAFAPVNPVMPVYSTAVINDPLVPNGWNTVGIADGSYELRLQGTDSCGHVATITHTIVIDNTAPVALISSPVNCAGVGGVVNVMGIASDANMAGWSLQYTGGNTNTWITIASGSTSVSGLLGSWNTAGLPDCAYSLRLVVSDLSIINCDDPHIVEYLVSVSIGGGGNDCPADLDGDGSIGLGDLAIVLSLFGSMCP